MNFLNNPSPAGRPDQELSALKNCQYPTCNNKVATEFQYCESCRVLALRNAMVILLDPQSPLTERAESIFHTAYHNMTVEEKLNATAKAENIYLQFLKFTKIEQLHTKTSKRSFESLIEEVEDARSASPTPRTSRKAKVLELKNQTKEQKRKAKIDKLAEGIPGADAWFKENLDF